jgi:glycosyltransferase involved in cell wall biosynthesis
MRPSNSGTTTGRVICGLVIGVLAVALAAVTAWVYRRAHDPVVVAYWWIGNASLLFCMFAFLKGRRFLHLPVAQGRVLAIVPAYEEDPAELDACIWSILNQRGAEAAEVHVVDDGSKDRAVRNWYHPRVFWHYKPNGGKRDAQCHVLDQLNAENFDFVLTVDGDSVLDPDALAHQLRAFSNPKVMASTGMVLVSNADTNLMTRLADINIGTSCVMMRASRSLLGTLETTSGALAVYRARIVFKHKDRYRTAGTYGDDRCLAMYSALEGEVVGVNESIVWSSMPTDLRTTYRQRLRRSKSWWCMIPFVLTNMTKFRQMFFPLFGLMQLVIAPITIGFALVSIALNAWRGQVHWEAISLYAAIYLLSRYAQVALYMVERPGMPVGKKLWSLLVLTPVEAAYNLLFLNPTKYLALLKLRDHGWGTRGNAHAALPAAAAAPAGPAHRAAEPDEQPQEPGPSKSEALPSRGRGRHRLNEDQPTMLVPQLRKATSVGRAPVTTALLDHDAAPAPADPTRLDIERPGWLTARTDRIRRPGRAVQD